jgi:hypothetical protein
LFQAFNNSIEFARERRRKEVYLKKESRTSEMKTVVTKSNSQK